MNRIYSIQAMRGIAAISVVLLHAFQSSNIFISSIYNPIFNYLNYGILGVDFFFVLSGFIIFNSHFTDEENKSAFKLYVFKRIIRIYPSYLPVSIAYIAIFSFFPNLSLNGKNWGFVSSILLLPSSLEPVLSLAWTLIYEVMFYIIFVLWFFIRSKFIFIMGFWLFLIVFFNIRYEHETSLLTTISQDYSQLENTIAIFKHLFSSLNIEFLSGMLCAFLYRKSLNWKIKYISIFLSIIIFIFLCYLMKSDELSITQNRVFFGISFSLLMYGIVSLEKHYKLKINSIILLFGDASYAIYLTHYPIVSIISRINAKIFNIQQITYNIVICLCASLLFGIIYYKYFERPFIKLIRNKLIKNEFSTKNLGS